MPSLILLLSLFALLISTLLAYRHRRLLRYGYQYLCLQTSLRWFLLRRKTVADIFDECVAQHGTRTTFVYEGSEYSYASLDRRSNRIAQWATEQVGLKPRDVVALMMENSVEFVAIWLGLAKVGVTTALVNTNLRGASLSHSMRCCDAKLVIVGSECIDALDTVRAELGPTMRIWRVENDHGITSSSATLPLDSAASSPRSPSDLSQQPKVQNLTHVLDQMPEQSHNFSALRRAANLDSSDLLFYIFTSGTTGLPKAAKIKHLRWQLSAASFVNFFGITKDDRIYCCLPMYHSAGGMIGVGSAWHIGGAVVLRRKFSASKFFEDCANYHCTIAQYIGQLARYLLASPPSPYDQTHSVRMMLGNGMAVDSWDAFRARFRIDQIAEFYASTEGNANLINNLNIKGVIGWIPPLARLVYPVRIVRFDQMEEKPVRNAAGFCIECAADETGELLSKIDARDPVRRFEGYTSARATSEKILTNVFRRGDQWFRSGDLVRCDSEGLIRFVDRVGDTYRWKGENVATTEVAAIVAAFIPQVGRTIGDVNVYGVYVVGNEGRAGMASISLESTNPPSTTAPTMHHHPHPSSSSSSPSDIDFDFAGLYEYLQTQLPSYQNPLFLRFQKELEMTSTFKQRKGDLVREGFDPTSIRDPLYFRDDQQKRYVKLDAHLYDMIQKGKVRV